MESSKDSEESTRKSRPHAASHLTLYTVPEDSSATESPIESQIPPQPQGPQPPHYERRENTRLSGYQQNQRQILLGVGVGLVCTLSLVGLLALPLLYRYYYNQKPYFADTLLVTTLLTIVVCLGSTLTLLVFIVSAAGLLFAHLPSHRQATVFGY